MVEIKKDTIPKLHREHPGPFRIEIIYVLPFKTTQKLVIKRFGRFKIIDESTVIPEIGLNTDYPTFYGRVLIKNDTAILKFEKTIQHFNKAAPKRRVKTNLNYDRRYTFQTKVELLSEDKRSYWSKIKK